MEEVKNWDVMRFYQSKAKHYELSDDFIRKYRQERGEYIKAAEAHSICTDQAAAEPNQKWHLLESYYGLKIAGGDIDLNGKATLWGGRGLKCPELLLWMAEAAGCDIKKAKEVAEKLCEEGQRCSAAQKIKEIIPWDEIETKIRKELNIQ